MTQSCSSESGVTMEIGLAPVGEYAAREWEHLEVSSSHSRCVIPKVHSAVNMRDQQVPVYWDQTVPVWPSCKQADLAPSRRKPALTPSGSSYSECYHTVYLKNRGGEEARNGKGGRLSAHAAGISSKISFDDIMSMYQSSLM